MTTAKSQTAQEMPGQTRPSAVYRSTPNGGVSPPPRSTLALRERSTMKISTIVLLVTMSATGLASAQTTAPLGTPDKPSPLSASTLPANPSAGETQVDPQLLQPVNPSIFKSIGHDFTGFFSTDTAKVLGVFAVAGLVARPVDHASVEDTS